MYHSMYSLNFLFFFSDALFLFFLFKFELASTLMSTSKDKCDDENKNVLGLPQKFAKIDAIMAFSKLKAKSESQLKRSDMSEEERGAILKKLTMAREQCVAIVNNKTLECCHIDKCEDGCVNATKCCSHPTSETGNQCSECEWELESDDYSIGEEVLQQQPQCCEAENTEVLPDNQIDSCNTHEMMAQVSVEEMVVIKIQSDECAPSDTLDGRSKESKSPDTFKVQFVECNLPKDLENIETGAVVSFVDTNIDEVMPKCEMVMETPVSVTMEVKETVISKPVPPVETDEYEPGICGFGWLCF